jgi:hypothetical protein
VYLAVGDVGFDEQHGAGNDRIVRHRSAKAAGAREVGWGICARVRGRETIPSVTIGLSWLSGLLFLIRDALRCVDHLRPAAVPELRCAHVNYVRRQPWRRAMESSFD